MIRVIRVGMRRRRVDPSPLKELLPGVLRGIKGPVTGPLARIRKAFEEIVGPAVASRTRVVAAESGRVRIKVASAALKQDLAIFRRVEVLEGIRKRLPELRIREVSYVVGSVS